jgi:Recombinase
VLPRELGPLRIHYAARLSQELGQTGIDSQEEYGIRHFESMGHTIVSRSADRKSGVIQPWKRKNLKPYVTDPSLMATYDAIGGLELDRLTRGDNQSTNEIEKWAWDNNKRLLTADGLFFPCEGEDGIRWDLAKRLAHAEWLKNSKRYRRMHSYLRDHNWLVGRRPFPYMIAGVNCGNSPCECKNDRKVLVPHTENADITREMARLAIEGESYAGIARWLNDKGVPTSNSTSLYGWVPEMVKLILTSETLIGKRRHGEGRTLMTFEPIFDRGEWNRLQAALQAKSRRKGAVRKEPAMLTGIAYCAKCFGIMHYRSMPSHWNTDYVWRGYRCDGKPNSPSRCKNMFPSADLEQAVDFQFTHPEFWEVAGREICTVTFEGGSDHDQEIQAVEDRIDEIDWRNDPDAVEKAAALKGKLQELLAADGESPTETRSGTGIIVADYWRTLSGPAKRRYMLAAEVKVLADHRGSPDVVIQGHPDLIEGELVFQELAA